MSSTGALRKLANVAAVSSAILRRKLRFFAVPILATNRCNSRCLVCNIWRKEPKVDLPIEIFRRILKDETVSDRTGFVLSGGEFILHPEYHEILQLFRGRSYWLLSNCLLPDRLIKAVREFKVPRLSISLDGPRTIYKTIRGVDAYSKVEQVVRELRDSTRINIEYNVTPWNTRKDLIHVADFCRKYHVDLWVGYYTEQEYFETATSAGRLYDVNDLIDHPYHRFHGEWASGNLKMPCFSIFARPLIRPNGDVVLCDPKEVVLGNLHQKSLKEIWTSKNTRAIQKQYTSCNGCWSDCHRPLDFDMISWAKTFIPRIVMQRILPGYDWPRIYEYFSRTSAYSRGQTLLDSIQTG